MISDGTKAGELPSGVVSSRPLPFFSSAAMVFVASVTYRWLLFSENGAQLTGPIIVAGFYALVVVSVALVVVGIARLFRTRAAPPEPLRLGRFANGAIAGVFLTLVSFFYQGGVAFENDDTGFPLQFSFRTDMNGLGPIHFQLLPAVLDFGFWFALCYLVLSGMASRSSFARDSLDWIAGVGAAFFFSVFAVSLASQNFGLSQPFFVPFFFLFNLALGYVQIRRGFSVMGSTIIGMGILLAVLSILIGQ
ncbi:MAG TPA: hypothetical protein VLY21_02895 [Nitrososphaerales archaeon]|nr:hypothetical protein [Nitrososphaerales archaeon]